MYKQRTKPTRGLGPSNWSICSYERRLYFVFSILVLKRNKTKKQQMELLDVSERNKQTSNRLVWLFAINRTTIPRIYNCSELVCAIVDLGIVGLSAMCAYNWHNLFIYLCKT